ncbi:MAG: site-specific integrase [Bacteroidales bacterium]
MKTTNTFGIVFYLRKYKGKDGKAPIYVRITVDGKRTDVSLKKDILTNNWNDAKGLAKGKTDEIRNLNTYLEQIRSRLVECYQELQLKKKLITADLIKNKFCGVEEKEHSLISLFDYHNKETENTLEWGTLKNYYTTKRYVQEFLKAKFNASDIYLSLLDYKFLADFERFMKTYVPKDQKLPCGQNTIMKHIERLRKVVNMSIKNDWLERDPFHKFKPVFLKTTRQFLTSDELSSIEQKRFKIERLEYAKDLFIFSCYTGLAYIDVFELTPQNIMLGIDGGYWITTIRHKTDIPVRIPLLSKPMEIINKYKNNPRVIEAEKLLPVYSNQKLNAYLKEIADLCGIEKPLTFHIARHTFATTITLTNGVPMETVSKLLGHTSIRTTQIYAKVIEQKVSDDMKTLRNKLEGQPLKPMLIKQC